MTNMLILLFASEGECHQVRGMPRTYNYITGRINSGSNAKALDFAIGVHILVSGN